MPDHQLGTGFKSVQAISGYAVGLFTICVDQLTKNWAESALTFRVPEPVTSWFDLTLAYNTGAAFSFLADAGGWQRWFFALIAVVISIVLVVWLSRVPRERWWMPIALGFVLGGGLGNLYDRVVLGHVVDFISVHYGSWYWPAFNIADSAITAGAVILVLDSFLTGAKPAAVSRN